MRFKAFQWQHKHFILPLFHINTVNFTIINYCENCKTIAKQTNMDLVLVKGFF